MNDIEIIYYLSKILYEDEDICIAGLKLIIKLCKYHEEMKVE